MVGTGFAWPPPPPPLPSPPGLEAEFPASEQPPGPKAAKNSTVPAIMQLVSENLLNLAEFIASSWVLATHDPTCLARAKNPFGSKRTRTS